MVKNYDRFGKTNIKVLTRYKIVWQRYIRTMVSHTADWLKINTKESAIKEAHIYFNALQNNRYRLRAYKRYGKLLREMES